MAEWPPLVVEVSIYGSTPEVYERVTGVPGSFRRCIRGIELLLDRQVRLRLKTVPTTLNMTDMEACGPWRPDTGWSSSGTRW